MNDDKKNQAAANGEASYEQEGMERRVDGSTHDSDDLPHCPVCLQEFKKSIGKKTGAISVPGFKMHLHRCRHCQYIMRLCNLVNKPIWCERMEKGELQYFKQHYLFHPNAKKNAQHYCSTNNALDEMDCNKEKTKCGVSIQRNESKINHESGTNNNEEGMKKARLNDLSDRSKQNENMDIDNDADNASMFKMKLRSRKERGSESSLSSNDEDFQYIDNSLSEEEVDDEMILLGNEHEGLDTMMEYGDERNSEINNEEAETNSNKCERTDFLLEKMEELHTIGIPQISNETSASLSLLQVMEKHNCSDATYKDIMTWAAEANQRGHIFKQKFVSRKHTIETMQRNLRMMDCNFFTEYVNLKPNNVLAEVMVCDVKAQLFQLLSNKELMKNENLDIPCHDGVFGNPIPKNQLTYIGPLSMGECVKTLC